jgi:hypothetical protein
VKTSEHEPNENGNATENGNPSGNVFNLANNPFLKCDKEEIEANDKSDDSKTKEEKIVGDNQDMIAKNLFKPAKTNLFKNATTLSENSNFVFGQNLHERVVIVSMNNFNAHHLNKIIKLFS